MKFIAQEPFSLFNRNALSDEENIILDGGIEKHTRILKTLLMFLPAQTLFPFISHDVTGLMTAVSFITLLLGGAWYTISFQNVSADQLDAGVADYITEKMFSAFMLSLSALVIATIASMTEGVFPGTFSKIEIPAWLKSLILLYNILWFLIVAAFIWKASTAYDAADSLLGDGFPTLMRGAKANAENEPLVALTSELIRLQGGNPEKVLKK
jgi:hypothetical protein